MKFVTHTKSITLASAGVGIMSLGVRGAMTSSNGYFWVAIFLVYVGLKIVVKA